MISNYIGIERIIERINRFKISGGYWNIEELKEWTYDTLEAINNQYSRIKATTDVEIVDDKAKIPIEVESLESIYVIVDGEKDRKLEEVLPYKKLDNYTYILNSGYIYTDLKEGEDLIRFEFYTVPLDDDDNPLIPDNRLYISAIEAYIQYMIAKRAYFQGKILERQLQMLEQEWLFYLPAAQASQKLDLMKDPKRFQSIHNKFIH
jgi:hypothetical protein